MRDGMNIHQFVEKVFTDEECEQLVEFYNESGASPISLGLLPFVNHAAMITALRTCEFKLNATYTKDDGITRLLEKLDLENYWVDITTISDSKRTEYNTVTEEYRYLNYGGINLFRNV